METLLFVVGAVLLLGFNHGQQRRADGDAIVQALNDVESDVEGVDEKVDQILDYLNITTTSTTPTPPSTTLSPFVEVCESGYLQFSDHCYYYSTEKTQWSGAREACQERDSYLVSVNSQEEQDFLVDNVPKVPKGGYFENDRWIGLVHAPPDRPEWLDGSPMSYTSWSYYEGNCLVRCGVSMRLTSGKGYWEDIARDYQRRYICEKEKLLTVPRTTPPPTTTTTTTTTTTPAPTTTARACPIGHVMLGGHCYMFEIELVPWQRAKIICQGQGDFLVSINSQEEHDLLIDYTTRYLSRKKGYWLGMDYKDNKLVWDDGSDVNFDLLPENESCLETGCRALFRGRNSSIWEVVEGEEKYYICERSP